MTPPLGIFHPPKCTSVALIACLWLSVWPFRAHAGHGERDHEPVRLVTNQKGDRYEGWLGPVQGVVHRKLKVRLYYGDRSTQPWRTYVLESKNLKPLAAGS